VVLARMIADVVAAAERDVHHQHASGDVTVEIQQRADLELQRDALVAQAKQDEGTIRHYVEQNHQQRHSLDALKLELAHERLLVVELKGRLRAAFRKRAGRGKRS